MYRMSKSSGKLKRLESFKILKNLLNARIFCGRAGSDSPGGVASERARFNLGRQGGRNNRVYVRSKEKNTIILNEGIGRNNRVNGLSST